MFNLKLSKKIVIDITLCTICIFGCFVTFNKIIEYQNSKNSMNNLKQQVEQSIKNEDKQSKILEKFNKMKEINDEYIGWLKINGTKVDYPVFQHKDNDFYLSKDYKKEDSIAGSIFVDHRNYNVLTRNKNTVIYGHNMKNGTMFGELKKFKNDDFVNKNQTIEIQTKNEVLKYKIFSVYKTNTQFNYIKTKFISPEDFGSFLSEIKSKSTFYKDIATEDDEILTLSTCEPGGKKRLVIHAVLAK